MLCRIRLYKESQIRCIHVGIDHIISSIFFDLTVLNLLQNIARSLARKKDNSRPANHRQVCHLSLLLCYNYATVIHPYLFIFFSFSFCAFCIKYCGVLNGNLRKFPRADIYDFCLLRSQYITSFVYILHLSSEILFQALARISIFLLLLASGNLYIHRGEALANDICQSTTC